MKLDRVLSRYKNRVELKNFRKNGYNGPLFSTECTTGISPFQTAPFSAIKSLFFYQGKSEK